MPRTTYNGQGTARLALILLILLLTLSSAYAIGIAPSRKVETYTGETTMDAVIVNNEGKTMKVLILPQGDLASYVTLDKNVIKVTKDETEVPITYTIKVPKNATSPGPNILRIAFIEVPAEFKEPVVTPDGQVIGIGEGGTISATAAVIQQVILNVPYPETYVEGKLYVTGDKTGEPVTFSLSLFDRGAKDANVIGYILIKGPTNEEIAKVDLGTATVKGMDEGRLIGQWTPDSPGEYIAEAYLTYGDKSTGMRETFLVGSPQVSIEEIAVKNFRLGSIAKFDVRLLSRWNKAIKGVTGGMQVIGKDGGVIDSFPTTPTDIPPHGMTTVAGYWDTEKVAIGDYDVNVLLSYEGRTSQKRFATVVSIDSIDVKGAQATGKAIGTKETGGQYTLLIVLIIVLIILNAGIFLYFNKLKGWLKRPPQNPPTPASKPSLRATQPSTATTKNGDDNAAMAAPGKGGGP